jgi:uncharacterized protein with GYD domain
MATFITLANFTDQGIKSVKDSPERFNAVKTMAEKAGLTVKSFHYTLGGHDMVLITEGAEDAYMSVGLKLGSLGNVRTETLRAFSVDEFKKFIAKMP